MKNKSIFFLVSMSLLSFSLNGPAIAEVFSGAIKNQTRIMIVITDAGNAGEFIGYAENLLKKAFKQKGAAIINPEIMEKVKADKLLWEAIKNGNATAMAKITTDYGAVILVRGTLSVDARQRFSTSWEGSASLSLSAVDTKTAEEIANLNSDPLGTTLHPAPMEDSPLIAKQAAVQKVCDSVLLKAGLTSSAGDITAAAGVQLELYDVFDLKNKSSALIFSTDGKKIFIASGNIIQVWGILERQVLNQIVLEDDAVAMDMAPNGRLLAVADSDGILYIWDTENNSTKMQTETAAGTATALAFKPDSATLAVAGENYKIRLVSVLTGKESAVLDGHENTINSMAFTPNGDQLISAARDLSTRWWDVNTAREKKAMTETTDKLLCMSLSQDGSLLALSTVDIHIDLMRNTRKDIRRIKVRNTVTGEEVRTLDGHQKDITTLAFHTSKRFLVSGAVDDSIRIWDIQKGEMVTFQELNSHVVQVGFSGDGKWLAALTEDSKLTVWKSR